MEQWARNELALGDACRASPARREQLLLIFMPLTVSVLAKIDEILPFLASYITTIQAADEMGNG